MALSHAIPGAPAKGPAKAAGAAKGEPGCNDSLLHMQRNLRTLLHDTNLAYAKVRARTTSKFVNQNCELSGAEVCKSW